MEKNMKLKEIDGILYKPSWTDTFIALAVGQEIKLSRRQILPATARATCNWVRQKQGFTYSVFACDPFEDYFIVKRTK